MQFQVLQPCTEPHSGSLLIPGQVTALNPEDPAVVRLIQLNALSEVGDEVSPFDDKPQNADADTPLLLDLITELEIENARLSDKLATAESEIGEPIADPLVEFLCHRKRLDRLTVDEIRQVGSLAGLDVIPGNTKAEVLRFVWDHVWQDDSVDLDSLWESQG